MTPNRKQVDLSRQKCCLNSTAVIIIIYIFIYNKIVNTVFLNNNILNHFCFASLLLLRPLVGANDENCCIVAEMNNSSICFSLSSGDKCRTWGGVGGVGVFG